MPSVTEYLVVEASQENVWVILTERIDEWAQTLGPNGQQVELLSGKLDGVGARFSTRSLDGTRSQFEVIAWQSPDYICFAPMAIDERDNLINMESQTFRLRRLTEAKTELELSATIRTKGPRGWLLGRVFWPGFQRAGLRSALDAVALLISPKDDNSVEGKS